MDHDEYNVISSNLVDNDGVLEYPENDGIEVVAPEDDERKRERVFNELENSTQTRKRRLVDIEDVYDKQGNFSHPLDWHMRMPLLGDEVEERAIANEAKRRALENLEKLINESPRETVPLPIEETRLEQSLDDIFETEMKRRFKRKAEVMAQPPVDGTSWVGVTDPNSGQHFYIRTIRQPRCHNPSLLHSITRQTTFGNRDLWKQADEWEQKRRETQRKEWDEKVEEVFGTPMEREEEQNCQHEKSLWVNKYAAKNFADLLTDHTVNRNILTWIKLWDECVFGKKVDQLIAVLPEKERVVFQLDNGKIRRPYNKMIILSGPAGLGKTTLAHIIAKQAGYAPVDVNASDVRTVADMNKVLEGAIKMTRTLDSDSRPNCLILDEIDGSTAETMRHLLRCLQATGKKSIRRPIIGICNNLYVPALRELRSAVWCVQLGAVNGEQLTRRISRICDSEGLRCDTSTLRRIVQACANDMRHTINTLQWASIRSKSKRIGMDVVQEILQKDKNGAESIFESWATILELSRHVNGKGGLQRESERALTIERIAMDHRGEDRFISGLHTNYVLPVPIGKLRSAAKWFTFYDHVQEMVYSTQSWTIQRYLYSFFVALHMIIATHARVKMQYPQNEQNYNQKLKESEEILNILRQGSRGTSRKDLIIDTLPLLVGIVQPPIKPMNEQLYTQREKAILNTIVSTMVAYGLTYQAVIVKDQPNWLFEPPIDVLTIFPLMDDRRRHSLANATRQLIAHKIVHLRVNLEPDHSLNELVKSNATKIKTMIGNDKKELKNNKRLSAGAIRRLRQRQQSDVFYEHKEGDSSAVKKKITLQELKTIIFGEH